MKAKKALIVGAGVAGKELLQELKKDKSTDYEILGFIDDDKTKKEKIIGGTKVLGDISNITKIVKENEIEVVFIAIPSAQGDTIRKIINKCSSLKVSFKIVPRLLEIVEGKVNINTIKELEIEDLLGRAIVKSEQKSFKTFFNGKKVLVTGGAGSIGSEIVRQVLQFSVQQVIVFDRWENGLYSLGRELENKQNLKMVVGDVTDKKKLRDTFEKFRPDFVFHAAAYKHVPLMQDNPTEAIKNNVLGTQNVVKACVQASVKKMIFISSDKAADPSSIMGATKLIGEKILDSEGGRTTKFVSVRFGNVLASHGSVIPLFQKQIAQGGPVTITDKNMKRFFMTIPEAVQLVLHASTLGKGGETFVLDMGEQLKIDDIARLMIRISGFVPDKDIQIKYIGMRPGEKMEEQLTGDSEKLLRTKNKKIFSIKKDNITNYIAELKNIDPGDEPKMWEKLREVAPELKEKENGNYIPLTRINTDKEELAAVEKVIKSGWLTMAQETEKFESEFANFVGAKDAIAVNSCTAALFLSLKALGVGEGDEVIVPSFTFAASVNVIIHAGAIPVFVDIKKDDFTIDQASLEKAVTKKTKAIMAVHYGGNRAAVNTNLPIIEDSAHLIPYKGDNKSSFTRNYSFYATKNITTGEGGMITTSDEKVAEWLRKARLHGLTRDAWKRYQVGSKWLYGVEFPGYKYNMADLNAALGRVQLRKLQSFEKRRVEAVELYNSLLGLENKGTHLYPILVKDRDKFFEYMKSEGIGCSFHFTPLHLQPAYKDYKKRVNLDVTEYIGDKVATIPLDSVITDSEIQKVSESIIKSKKLLQPKVWKI